MQSFLGVILGIFFLGAAWNAVRIGYSRSLAERSSESRQLSLADAAVKLSPLDAETHYHRAELLWAGHDKAGAIREAERAVSVRPRDYFLWFRLGFYRYGLEDKMGALSAFREASRLAPYYAQPHYYIGSILLETGARDEAFAELRYAAASDSEFLPDLIALAGNTFGDDTKAIELAVQPHSQRARLALAKYFVQRGKTDEAMMLIKGPAGFSEKDQKTLLLELLRAKRFVEAFDVWNTLNKGAGGVGQLRNGSFENQINLGDPGFGWQQPRNIVGARTSLDSTLSHSGAQSISLEFDGEVKPANVILTELVRVEPNSRYSLQFAVRTSEIVTGGIPIISVQDATSNAILAEVDLENDSSNNWEDYSMDFATAETTNTIVISLQRRNCRALPCPIFGRMWLDSFTMSTTN